MESTFAKRWIRKFRILTISLIFSGALNIALIAACFLMQAGQDVSWISPKEAGSKEEMANLRLLSVYSKKSFRELASLLTNIDVVEEGYRKRDLALSALVAFHSFHLDKALGGAFIQRRVIHCDDQTIEFYPGLSDEQFQALIRYAYLEKWPLTAKGLFAMLQKQRDEALEQSFAVTSEFYALQALFQKSSCEVSSNDLIDLVSEGNWQMLEGFVREQTQMLDLSDDRRRRLLLSYLAQQSHAAAKLLLRTDFQFALKRLDDRGILDLLSRDAGDLLPSFCLELLKSPRSDSVWAKSAELLYRFAGEEIPQPFDAKVALARFAPEGLKQVKEAPKPIAKEAPKEAVKEASKAMQKTHIVKEGESLWKISRIYKVKPDEIIALNGLEKDKIRPGMVLAIPQGTGSQPPR